MRFEIVSYTFFELKGFDSIVAVPIIQIFQRHHLIIFILEPLYSCELNEKISNIYMNRSAIDEENQVEISGVYHMDPWQSFRRFQVEDRADLEKFSKNRTDYHSNHKRIIVEALERYTKETNQLDEKLAFLHIVWAGILAGDGNWIQKDQLLFHFLQSELDRFKIKQALFTNYYMLKNNVISKATLEKLYDPQNYDLQKTINTRPFNEPIIRENEMGIYYNIYTRTFSVSIGDAIDDFIFRVARLNSGIRNQHYYISY